MSETIDDLGLPKPLASAAWEARAQLTWGEPPAEVRRFLLEKGFDEGGADRVLALLARERDTSIRAKGARDTLTGTGLLAVTVPGLLFYQDGIRYLLQFVSVPTQGASIVLIALIAASLAGGVFLLRGVERLVQGGKLKGADTDIQD